MKQLILALTMALFCSNCGAQQPQSAERTDAWGCTLCKA